MKPKYSDNILEEEFFQGFLNSDHSLDSKLPELLGKAFRHVTTAGVGLTIGMLDGMDCQVDENTRYVALSAPTATMSAISYLTHRFKKTGLERVFGNSSAKSEFERQLGDSEELDKMEDIVSDDKYVAKNVVKNTSVNALETGIGYVTGRVAGEIISSYV